MDKKSLTQFIIVSVVIVAGWWIVAAIFYGPGGPRNHLLGDAPEQPSPAPPAPAEPVDESAPARVEDLTPVEDPAPTPAEAPPAPTEEAVEPEPVAEELVLDNKHLRLHFTNVGAALLRLVILDEAYKAPYEEDGERPPLVLLSEFQPGLLSDVIESITFIDPTSDPATRSDVQTDRAVYQVVEQSGTRAVFQKTVRDGRGHALQIRKTVRLDPETYHYNASLSFRNLSDKPYQFSFRLRGAAGIERENLEAGGQLGTRVGRFDGSGYDIDNRSARGLAVEDEKPNESAGVAWAAVVNHYFAAVTQPEDPDWIDLVASEKVTETTLVDAEGRWNVPTVRRMSRQERQHAAANAMVVFESIEKSLAPAGGSFALDYRFIGAPKEKDVLARYDAGMPDLTEFGIFAPLSRIAVAILNAIHAVIPNYGVAILLLTVIVRVLMHPLTRKQQVSMIKMQKLQPRIQEIQRKYADDKQKQTEEQMQLFQKYGVHPLSGCFPILLQMPIFIALFRALRAAIELRHAGFLWISDLSQPDAVLHLPFQVPILGYETLNIMPLLMAVVMVLQQRTMPRASTEQAAQQQNMMKWFPLIFVLLLYNLPSGLVLYWTTSSGFAWIERWFINRHADEIELTPVAKRTAKSARRTGAPSKSAQSETWLDKLQRLVEEQTRGKKKGKK